MIELTEELKSKCRLVRARQASFNGRIKPGQRGYAFGKSIVYIPVNATTAEPYQVSSYNFNYDWEDVPAEAAKPAKKAEKKAKPKAKKEGVVAKAKKLLGGGKKKKKKKS